ncbi:hypothetical protein ACOSQ3_027865 [Xanthoceras sorbifolium]
MGSDMDNSSVVKGKSMTNTIGVRKRIGKIRQKRNVGKSPIPSTSGGVDDDNVTSRQKAECWEHFTIYYTKEGKKRSKCNYCGTTYSCAVGSGSGTSNMNLHLNKKCQAYRAAQIDPTQKNLMMQTTMDGYGVTGSVNTYSFNKDECRRALAEMIIIDELPFRFVENRGFRRFCSLLCPTFEVPSRRTIVRDLYKLYIDEKAILKKRLRESKVRVSLTTDTWTSIQNINYMVVTAHFIDSDWQLQKRILSFTQIGDHKGDSIGRSIENILLEWGIERVFTITVDNATANTTAVQYLIRKLNSWHVDGTVLGGRFLHVRCCAHILNLIVNDGLRDMDHSVLSIRNAVKYVKSSPSRLEKFKKCVAHEKIEDKGLVVLDVPTRWNSTYLMLFSAVKFRKAFERLEEEDGHYMTYFCENENGKQRVGPPSAVHWDNAKVFIRFLETFYDITLDFSASLHVTSNAYVVGWSTILNQLRSLSVDNDQLVIAMATSMQQKFDKYWGSLDKTNNLLIIACLLDPRYKLGYILFRFQHFYGAEIGRSMTTRVRQLLEELYIFYRSSNSNVDASRAILSCGGGGECPVSEQPIQVDKYKVREAKLWENYQQELHVAVEKTELELYLLENCEPANTKFDILSWWKNSCTKYPILSCIAKDVFAMQVSTVASESAFSTSGRILDPFRSSLTPKLVEGLICSQNWLQATFPISEPETLVLDVHAQKEDNCVQNEELYEAVQNGEFDNYLVLFIF